MSKIESEVQYNEEYELAKLKSDTYWDKKGKEFFWFKDYDKVSSGDFNDLDIKWFNNGKTNIAYNCLDRNLESRSEKTALIWESNDPNESSIKYSFKELHEQVCKTSNALKSLGIKKGDRVCLYMGMVPELMISVLACARIGAIHSVVFGGFSAKALSERINDCEAKLLITNDGSYRGNKKIELKKIVDEALENVSCVEKVIVHDRLKNQCNMVEGRDIKWETLLEGMPSVHEAEVMDSEDPLFILYTSGSTGRPKGLLHTTAGYMVYAKHSFENVFQMEEEDIYWCSADIGWITGHTYITYGPLLNGSTTMMFEGVPTYPDAGRFWQIIDKYKVTHFYTAPTAIRALEACDISYVKNANLSSLKVLGSVGEPINEEAWDWYHKHVGKNKCPIVDTWWQTETGGIMISPLAHITEMKPTFATNPLPGVLLELVDENGKIVEGNGVSGNLCIKRPWPSIARTIWGDHERYKQTYFSTYPGKYFTGDGAKRDEQGHYRITGRVDDVINVSGHRIGTAEVEDAINLHESVVESAVVGFPHDIKGQALYAFVISLGEYDENSIYEEIINKVNQEIGPIARPDKILFVSGLPKTRSGKIMRRILRKIAEGDFDNLGDTTTLAEPAVVESLLENSKKL